MIAVPDRQQIADTLNRLPFVRWDRFVDVPAELDLNEGSVDVYGWIDREDQRSDFVIATFPRPIDGTVGYTTSSDRHSAEIGLLLHGEESEHVPCQRVESVFGDLVESKVVLV